MNYYKRKTYGQHSLTIIEAADVATNIVAAASSVDWAAHDATNAAIGMLLLRMRAGDRTNATASVIADADRAALVFYAACGERGRALRIDAIMRGEDPAQRFACGEMLEEDI